MESLPNIHPALTHFPLALWPVAFAIDLASLTIRRARPLASAAILLYVLAAVGGGAAYFSGRQAEDSLGQIPASVQMAVVEHADWGTRAAVALAILAALRLAFSWWQSRKRQGEAKGLRWGLLGLCAIGLFLLFETAEHGGELVFGHGLAVGGERGEAASEGSAGQGGTSAGVHPAERLETSEPGEKLEVKGTAGQRFRRLADGGIEWTPQPGDRDAVGEILKAAPGASADAAVWKEPSEGEQGLGLEISGKSLLVLPGEFGDMEVEALLDLDAFQGTVGLAHHVRSAGDAGLFVLTLAGAALQDLRDGKAKDLDRAKVERPSGPLRLAVSSVGSHLKGTIGGTVVVHGHVSTPPRGSCGLYFDGKGSIRVRELTVRMVGSERR